MTYFKKPRLRRGTSPKLWYLLCNGKRVLTFVVRTPRERCGGDLVATVTGGTILSPGFASDRYYDADICEWRITTSRADQQV